MTRAAADRPRKKRSCSCYALRGPISHFERLVRAARFASDYANFNRRMNSNHLVSGLLKMKASLCRTVLFERAVRSELAYLVGKGFAVGFTRAFGFVLEWFVWSFGGRTVLNGRDEIKVLTVDM